MCWALTVCKVLVEDVRDTDSAFKKYTIKWAWKIAQIKWKVKRMTKSRIFPLVSLSHLYSQMYLILNQPSNISANLLKQTTPIPAHLACPCKIHLYQMPAHHTSSPLLRDL